MKEELNIVTLENNNDYIVVDEIKSNEKKFIYLCSMQNSKDYIIRKEVVEHGMIYLQGLNNETEVVEALLLLQNKNA